VAELTDGVKLNPKKSRTMQPSEVKDLLSSIVGDRIEPVLHVMLATGLRRSEVLGLCWGNVDLTASPATLQISHALKRERSGLVFGEPKTRRTKRVLYIPDVTARILREHRVTQMRERLEFGPGWGGEWVEHDFVFTTPVGTPIDPSNFAKALSKATRFAGLGSWSPHEFRHTAASLMIASGVPLKQASEALGHSSIAVTADVYGHLLAPSTATADAMAHVMYGT
jgi:integrase